MMKLFRIYRRIALMSLKKAATYRIEIITSAINATSWFLMQIVFTFLLYNAGAVTQIANITKYEMLFILIMGQFAWMILFTVIIHNIAVIFRQMNAGMLDHLLVKPTSSYFLLFFQEMSFRNNVPMLFYLILAFIALMPYYFPSLSIMEWLSMLLIIITSVIVFIAFVTIALSINFFYKNFYGAISMVMSMTDISRYPKDIYPSWLVIICTFIVPLFLMINPFYEVLHHTFSLSSALWQLGLTCMFVIAASIMWSSGIKRYSSAG